MLRLAALAVVIIGAFMAPAGAGPLPDCLPTCTVVGANGGFVPPVIEVRSGAAVVWESLDSTHVNADGVLPNDPACFFVTYAPGSPSEPVVFEAGPGGVTANGEACASAVPAAGGFVVPYWCVLHPQMRGAIVVMR